MPRSDSVNPGRAAVRPSSSAPRTRSPAASGTAISGPILAPRAAAAAWRRSPMTRPGLPPEITCPASEPASGAVRFTSPAASGPAAPVTITSRGSPPGTARTAKSASAADAA